MAKDISKTTVLVLLVLLVVIAIIGQLVVVSTAGNVAEADSDAGNGDIEVNEGPVQTSGSIQVEVLPQEETTEE